MANSSSSSSSSGGIGFVGLLTIVFITLKLLGKITWSWWWVLSPLWISAGLAVAIAALVFGGALAAAFISGAVEEFQLKRAREWRSLGARRTSGRVIDVERKKDDSFIH